MDACDIVFCASLWIFISIFGCELLKWWSSFTNMEDILQELLETLCFQESVLYMDIVHLVRSRRNAVFGKLFHLECARHYGIDKM